MTHLTISNGFILDLICSTKDVGLIQTRPRPIVPESMQKKLGKWNGLSKQHTHTHTHTTRTHTGFHNVNFKCVHYKWIKAKSQRTRRPIPVSHINHAANTLTHKSLGHVVPGSWCFGDSSEDWGVLHKQNQLWVSRGVRISARHPL